jgi:hypothetical protein
MSLEPAPLYFADCGDLRLEIQQLPKQCVPVFEFRVVDKRDGGIYWTGNCSSLEDAQSSALLEARTFADIPAGFTQRWMPRF